ncbi:hypothetical protein B5S28_g4360 [[Candida] boidinii]|nr:hypothetical protein B5S28_g4360 [[Candida] boidinii]OWB59152.1 hypothetical protein B5S29_g6 [[Candida] boidinii]
MSVLESKKVNPNLIAVGFLEYYYNLINSQAANLYQMYTKNATLNHSLKPFKKFENVKGIDNIKEFWNKSELRGAKFMIQTIDVEEVDEKSILLSCTGEFALPDPLDEDTPSQRFVHTFILFSENYSRYDVINEMLRIIPDIDDEEDEEDDDDGKLEESKEVEKVESKDKIEPKVETTPEAPKEESKLSVAPTSNGSVTSNNKKSIEETEDQVFTPKENSKESTPETAPEVEEEKTSTPAQLKKLPDLPSTPAKPPTSAQSTPSTTPASIPPKPTKPFSWADAASANAKKVVKSTELADSASSGIASSANGHASSSAITTAAPVPSAAAAAADKTVPTDKATSAVDFTTVPTSSATTTSKSEKKDSKTNTKNGSNASSSSGLSKSANGDDNTEEGLLSKKLKKSFINKKGEAVYPIYIKGVERGITQQELISALEKKFGKVDSCKIESFIALVDFTEHQSQIDAIKVGTLKVKNTTIRLEPRVSKKESKSTGNGNGNGNKSDNNNNNNSNNNNNKKKKKNDKHNGSHIVNDSDGFQKVVK